MGEPVTFLMDNGSLEPAATLRLRELAEDLGRKIGTPVEPVSLLHSSGAPVAKLGGVPAEILEPALERRLQAGQRDFVIVPLFFGPSSALTDYLPKRIAHLRTKFPKLGVKLAAPLFTKDDDRLALILADHVREGWNALPSTRSERLEGKPLHLKRVALVDHGSPARVVVEVRNQLAAQLGRALGDGFTVAAGSMERREGAEYDFCEPLLERLLTRPGWNDGEVIIAMQFLLPGRHAGPEGDVAKICRAAEEANPALRTRMTPLVGAHPLLVDILADRRRAVLVEV